MKGIIHRYLDPSESLLEILFGLIMALTMTAGARLILAPTEINVTELIGALIGCNVAWGIIDAAFYLLGSRFIRNRRAHFVRRLQATRDETQAIALVREEFALEDEPPVREDDKAQFYRSLLEMLRHARAERPHFLPSEFAAATIILVLVAATALPGLIPLLLIGNTTLALKVANFLQVLLLFVIGYRWGHISGASAWQSAAIVGLLGVALVLVAVALGG